MRKNTIVALFAFLMLSVNACAQEKQQGPGTKGNPTSEWPDNLPTPGAEEVFAPSLITTKYRPVTVDYLFYMNSPQDPASWGKDPKKTAKTRLLYYITGFEPDVSPENYRARTNRYGSRTDWPNQGAAGRFRVTKIDGRWWIIDPEGYMYYHRGMASFREGETARQQAAFAARYGSTEQWVERSVGEFNEMGFHASGGFSTPYTHIQQHNAKHPDKPMVYSPSLGFIAGARTKGGYKYPGGKSANGVGVVYYPDFKQRAAEYAATALQPFLNDKNLLGVFSDNELIFKTLSSYILHEILKETDASHPAKQAAAAFMQRKSLDGTAAAFEALPTARKEELNNEFAGETAEIYFRTCNEVIKALDPNMMYLGMRIASQSKYLQGPMEAAGRHCDIVSINYYSRWSAELDTYVKWWNEWMNKPFMVTEFYAMGMESGMGNGSGAGFIVRRQVERAWFYQNFTLSLLETKHCVGWDWFRYQDDDSSNTNKGVYDNNYEPWPDLKLYMRHLNYNVYDLTRFFDRSGLN